MNPIVLVVTSDHHVGSTLGLCPPEGVRLDDGGRFMPSKPQRWTWECWEAFWRRVHELHATAGGDLWLVYNGDLFEGDHHGSGQIISKNPQAAEYLADRTFGVARSLHPTKEFVIRGTEAHTGVSGSTEESFAHRIQSVRDPEAQTWSWWHLRLDLNGLLLDFQHHGRMGQRPWTEANVTNLLAAQIFFEHARRKLRHPDLSFRSHFHRSTDSGDSHPTRVIQTPAWQLKTAYAHKVVPDSIADIGGIVVIIEPEGKYRVEKIFYQPSLPEPYHADQPE